jgi:hypothetical protein
MSKKKLSPKKVKEMDAAADAVLAATPPAQPGDGQAVVVVERRRIKWADTTAGGAPKQTMMNATLAIEALKLKCQQNVFNGK